MNKYIDYMGVGEKKSITNSRRTIKSSYQFMDVPQKYTFDDFAMDLEDQYDSIVKVYNYDDSMEINIHDDSGTSVELAGNSVNINYNGLTQDELQKMLMITALNAIGLEDFEFPKQNSITNAKKLVKSGISDEWIKTNDGNEVVMNELDSLNVNYDIASQGTFILYDEISSSDVDMISYHINRRFNTRTAYRCTWSEEGPKKFILQVEKSHNHILIDECINKCTGLQSLLKELQKQNGYVDSDKLQQCSSYIDKCTGLLR